MLCLIYKIRLFSTKYHKLPFFTILNHQLNYLYIHLLYLAEPIIHI
nr:MAG TPA: hypothetical protein [Caudoviricetes sp.]